MIAVARIMMPRSVVRLSAGRQYMTDELQALCFVAGANSIFIGDVLLTTKNPQTERDANLLDRLGIKSRLDDVKHHGHAHADAQPAAATVSASGAAAS
jgi:biotin synthase